MFLEKLFQTHYFDIVTFHSNVPNWSEDVFVIGKVKNTVPWTYVIRNQKKKKKNQKQFKVEKVI